VWRRTNRSHHLCLFVDGRLVTRLASRPQSPLMVSVQCCAIALSRLLVRC
jgi:hypothetical protein